MNPLDELQSRGHEARWLRNASAPRTDRLGTLHYELRYLDAAALQDLARLSLDGWMTNVLPGYGRNVRVALRPPEARA